MLRLTDLALPLDHTEDDLRAAVVRTLALMPGDLLSYHVHRKAIDARKRNTVRLAYTIDAEVRSEQETFERGDASPRLGRSPDMAYQLPARAPAAFPRDPAERPVVVGTGPCGLFAGLVLAQAGFRPILLERGKPVERRTADVRRFWRTGRLEPESNVQFGEGGAGTFSDGKLNTQIKDRGNRCRKILEELAAAGAPPEILIDAKPHVGTDLLTRVVRNLRVKLLELGAEVRFESRVTGFQIEDGAIRGVRLADGAEIAAHRVILAIGHSARDTFEALHEAGVRLEPKPFAIGARIEHPQTLIDGAQYGACAGHSRLGAADYKLAVRGPAGRSVYTFCMCPGGEVIAAASEPERVVTNGMSAHARAKPNANSALLVGIEPADFTTAPGGENVTFELAGVAFQRHWERLAFEAGGGDYRAPAQLVGDLLAGRPSTALADVEPSYRPGITLGDLADCLPPFVIQALREAIPALDRKLAGFARPGAVLTGVETRSSSPVRIVRDATFESANVRGLYPAGEGSGYAGGIMSSAVDGIRAAEAVAAALAR